ncbi:hypothetical protein DITRI_Ditri02bG0163800 [Diplodiscus trichospermus]
MEAKVSDLIDSTIKTWRWDLINSSFNEEDANYIGFIPISKLGLPDQLIWYYESNGFYYVRGAYRLFKMDKEYVDDDNLDLENQRWKKLWKVHVPNKIKVFLWKFKSGYIPVKAELRRRHISFDFVCFRCAKAPETIANALKGCDVTRGIWDHANFS